MDSFIGRTVAGLSEQDGIGFIGHVVFGLEVGAASRKRNRMEGNWREIGGKLDSGWVGRGRNKMKDRTGSEGLDRSRCKNGLFIRVDFGE
jgi:hypothetical protein